MTEELFAVFDSAAGAFLPPFNAQTIEVAMRRFRASLQHPDNQMAKFPEDYTLFHIGTFSAETAQIVPVIPPHSLGVAVTYMDRKTGPQIVEE